MIIKKLVAFSIIFIIFLFLAKPTFAQCSPGTRLCCSQFCIGSCSPAGFTCPTGNLGQCCTTELPPREGIVNPALNTSLQNLTGGAFISRLSPSIIGLLFIVGLVIFLFVLLLGAISFITSGGDKMQVEAARKKITNGLIGIGILFSAYAIISLIEIIFGTDLTLFNINDFAI